MYRLNDNNSLLLFAVLIKKPILSKKNFALQNSVEEGVWAQAPLVAHRSCNIEKECLKELVHGMKKKRI